MTCIERLRELHPDFTNEDIDNYVFDCCPETDGIADDPEWCCLNNVNLDVCRACWDREVPEEKAQVQVRLGSLLDRCFPLREIYFSEIEDAVIREMSHKLGEPREEIVRMAVREMWMRFEGR